MSAREVLLEHVAHWLEATPDVSFDDVRYDCSHGSSPVAAWHECTFCGRLSEDA